MRDAKMPDAYITQSRDIAKANKSVNYNQSTRELLLPSDSIIKFIRIADNQCRIEIISSPDPNLKRVKFYMNNYQLGNLEIEPYK